MCLNKGRRGSGRNCLRGENFLRAAKDYPDAWSAAQVFLDYKTFLNTDLLPVIGPPTPLGNPNYRTTTTITGFKDEHRGYQRAYSITYMNGHAPPDKSARLEALNNPQPEGSGVALIVVDGGDATFGLDGEYARNVVIRNADVSYAGGPTRLENVYFVNCKFHANFLAMPRTMELGQQILASTPTTYEPKEHRAARFVEQSATHS